MQMYFLSESNRSDIHFLIVAVILIKIKIDRIKIDRTNIILHVQAVLCS